MKVCCKCGEKKSSEEFYNNFARNECKACFRKVVQEASSRKQAETENTAEARGQVWSELEIQVLLDGKDEGLTHKDLTVLLGRTYYAINSKLRDVRKMQECGDRPVEPTQRNRDKNYVASAPDEDRWWEPGYYRRAQ